MNVQKKIGELEERYYLDKEMPQEVYNKLRKKLVDEKLQAQEKLANTPYDSLNLKKHFSNTVNFSLKLSTGWGLAQFDYREKCQKLVFPEGFWFNFKNETFHESRTEQLSRGW